MAVYSLPRLRQSACMYDEGGRECEHVSLNECLDDHYPGAAFLARARRSSDRAPTKLKQDPDPITASAPMAAPRSRPPSFPAPWRQIASYSTRRRPSSTTLPHTRLGSRERFESYTRFEVTSVLGAVSFEFRDGACVDVCRLYALEAHMVYGERRDSQEPGLASGTFSAHTLY